MTNLKKIEKFLLTEIAPDLGRQSLGPDEDLLDQSIIDSLGILKLVSFLEGAYRIQVIDEDIIPENFQSLNTIVRFIEQKTRSRIESQPAESQAEQAINAARSSPGPLPASRGILPIMPLH